MSRRRTLIANEIPNLQFDTDIIDDEADKRRRVSERFESAGTLAARKRQTGKENESTNKTANKTPVVARPEAPKPSNEQLSCLYNNCVKLLNENKINVKNAFQLKLIDYMSEIVLNSEISGGVTNFQVVGCTIDVGSKIYAARVDALHQNTYKVLSGLNNQGSEASEESENGSPDGVVGENEVDENGDEEDPNGKKAKAAKKRRLKKSSYIVTAENIDSITLKIRDEYKDEDLFFAKKSTCIENEAIGGILMNKLQFQDDSVRLLINSDDQAYSATENVRRGDCEMNFKGICDLNCDLKNLKLCNDLSNFKFIDYHLDENADMTKLVDNMSREQNEALEAHRFDANNLQMSRLDISLNNMGDNIDIDECCNDFENDVENLDLMDPDSNHPPLVQQISGLDLLDDMKVMNSIADLTTLITHTSSDYSYFNFDKLRILNLPKHLKKIAHTIALESQNGTPSFDARAAILQKNAKGKKMAPKVSFAVFENECPKLFKSTKKAVYLGDRTIEKRSEKPARLETERQLDYEAKELLRPYGKPTTAKIMNNVNPDELVENLLANDEAMGVQTRNDSPHDHDMGDDDIGGLNEDFDIEGNAATQEPFFTQGGNEFNLQTQQENMNQLGDMDLMQQGDLDQMGLNASRFDGENMIQAPMQVNAMNIEYAKTAKNIDVRRLKQVIWSLLCNLNVDKENINNSTNEATEPKKTTNVEVNASLKAIYKQLVPPLITQRVYDDLSICIVFQMILFLANEHNLLLKHDSMGLDVQITNY